MPWRLIGLFALLILACAAPFAASGQGPGDNRQKIRPLGDPIWEDLDAVLLDAGRVELSPTPPYSDARILAELDAIDPARLSAPAQDAYSRIRNELSDGLPLRSGPMAAKIGLDATPALEWRSSKSAPWIVGYADRPPLLSVPFELSFADSVYGYSALALTADPDLVAAEPLSGFGFNAAELAAAPIGVDTTFPFRAFGSVGGSWWNFQIGRDRLSFGSAGPWNLTISPAAEFYDFARLTLFAPGFAYSGLVIQLDPERNLYLHRFDFRFGGGFSLGLTEASLVGYAPLELRFFNPLMVFHGYEAWSDYTASGISSKEGSSNEIGMEINWSPLPWFAFSAQYAMNQISDPLKALFWPTAVSEIPNGEAYLASLSLRAPLWEAFFVAKLTGAYTTPLAYLSPGSTYQASEIPDGIESPISWIYDRPSKSNYGPESSLAWIGFSEGPDTILADFSAGLDAGAAWSVLADFEWMAHGQEDSFTTNNDWDTVGTSLALLTTPSGTAEYDFVTGLSARSLLPPLPFGLKGDLSGGIHWTGRWNADHVTGAWDQSWEIDAATTFGLK